MRTLTINIQNNRVDYPQGNVAGRTGEHLMTQLIISLPPEMLDEKIEFYQLSFCRFLKEERILSNRILEGEDDSRAYRVGNRLYFKLWQPVTLAPGVFFTVEGCRSILVNGKQELQFLCKSPQGRLIFEKAVAGEEQTDVRKLYAAGVDGKTPRIGENGNWWIGDTDTGTSASGLPGEPGADGFSPSIRVASDTPELYTLTITSKDKVFTTPNLKGGGQGAALTRYTFPLDWHYETMRDPNGTLLARKMWATLTGYLPAGLWERAVTKQISLIEGAVFLPVPVFNATISGLDMPPFGFVEFTDNSQKQIMLTGDAFLIQAEELYNREGEQAFQENFNYIFSQIQLLAADEIHEPTT